MKISNCECGKEEGKKLLLCEDVRIGITIKLMPDDYDGTFIDNKACYINNNYCPQCGIKYSEL